LGTLIELQLLMKIDAVIFHPELKWTLFMTNEDSRRTVGNLRVTVSCFRLLMIFIAYAIVTNPFEDLPGALILEYCLVDQK
jgi:hypothetical protein